jgi:hypothetical protein
MIHHGCKYNHNKMTAAVMGYDGRYRCAECKRRVSMDVDDSQYERDLKQLPYIEPPYPDGWCNNE